MEVKFFLSNDKTVKELIRKQGVGVCREELDQDVLNFGIEKCDYGFVSMLEKASVGKSRMKLTDRFKVNGFALLQEISKYELHLHLICVEKQHKGEGLGMMESVIQFAKENGHSTISLNSLPFDRLISWYKSFGFQVDYPIYQDQEVKVVRMVFFIEKGK